MASQQAGNLAVKPSFAKVAAMALPSRPQAVPNGPPKTVAPNTPTYLDKAARVVTETLLESPVTVVNPQVQTLGRADISQGVIEGIERLAVEDKASSKGDPLIRRGQGGGVPGGTDSTEDDGSHLSSSSTKGPSFDTKSMASVTTFAMDEKESLRPDDSASVQAGDEEDHQFPSVGGITSSHLSSDVGAVHARVQHGFNIPTRRPPLGTMLNPPRFGDLPLPSPEETSQPAADAQQPDLTVISPPVPHTHILSVAPDEKLIDAMGTPKDRLLLLQLEEKIVAFITQSQDEYVDLPPQNSFGRLLAHKLADYYNLAHYINSDNSSVRLFRGVGGTLPTPLGIIVSSLATNAAQQTGATAMKIMRRGGSTPASSSGPSKATSEIEGDSDEGLISPSESTPSKDKSKWTREEKEAHYKAARERIFGGFQGPGASENNSTGEASASMSRSSSSSGKRKIHRQRAPKDDSFEARSQFVPGYGGMTYSATPAQYQPPTFGSAPYPSPYASNSGLISPSGYGTNPAATFPAYESQATFSGVQNYPSGYQQQYGSNESWSNPQSPQPGSFYNYGTPNQPSPMYPPQSMASSTANHYFQSSQPSFPQTNQNWTPGPYPVGFQQPTMAQSPPAVHWPNFPPHANSGSTPPYQYGQLPSHSYGNNFSPSSQHPLPGSFNRSIFNPQTRSFVPANSSGRFSTKGGKSGQGKSSGGISGKTSNGISEHVRQEGLNVAPARSVFTPQLSQPASNGFAAPKAPTESIQKKWGTPSHLPKKPPPSQVPSAFDIETTPGLASQQPYSSLTSGAVTGSPLVVSGGGAGFAGGVNGGVAAGS